jgi:hypothetical protein
MLTSNNAGFAGISTIAAAAALLAIFAACISLLIRMRLASVRRARLANLELTPNCLLTRYPIVFISTPPSLFRFRDPWHDVAAYLREHGYDVFEIPVSSVLTQSVIEFGPCHVIADSAQTALLQSLSERKIATLETITLVHTRNSEAVAIRRKNLDIEDLKPREGQSINDFSCHSYDWKSAPEFLSLAISLAEHDAKCSD